MHVNSYNWCAFFFIILCLFIVKRKDGFIFYKNLYIVDFDFYKKNRQWDLWFIKRKDMNSDVNTW